MEKSEKLPSKEILRNIEILNQLQGIFAKFDAVGEIAEFHEKKEGIAVSNGNEKQHAKNKGIMRFDRTPVHMLCRAVDTVRNEAMYPTLFGMSREALRTRISALLCDLSRDVEDDMHGSSYGSFGMVAADLQDILWERNVRGMDGHSVMRHF